MTIYLFATIRRQVEYQEREKGYPHTRQYEIDRIKQRLPPQFEMEGYVEVRIRTTIILDTVSYSRCLHDIPFDILVVFTQVCADIFDS
jgi:hypothetical protein